MSRDTSAQEDVVRDYLAGVDRAVVRVRFALDGDEPELLQAFMELQRQCHYAAETLCDLIAARAADQ